MFKIFNEIYYVDIDAIDEYVQFTAEVLEDDVETEDDVAELKEEKQIHLVKYETIKLLVDIIVSEDGEVDENLGLKSNEVSIPFKIAFNSLLMKKIINKL
jgi:hypothetical protein